MCQRRRQDEGNPLRHRRPRRRRLVGVCEAWMVRLVTQAQGTLRGRLHSLLFSERLYLHIRCLHRQGIGPLGGRRPQNEGLKMIRFLMARSSFLLAPSQGWREERTNVILNEIG